ncbi:hypothetical protein BH24PSE2_BH24PSE2_12430 [soil metagenome]
MLCAVQVGDTADAWKSQALRFRGTFDAVTGHRLKLLMLLPVAATVGHAASGLRLEHRAERLTTVSAESGDIEYILVPVEDLGTGGEIYFTIAFTNVTGEALVRATVTARILPGMRYVGGSASGPGTDISFSIDGGATFAGPEELVSERHGKGRPVPPRYYTDIRWTMRHPLAPAATAYARYRAVGSARRATRGDPGMYRSAEKAMQGFFSKRATCESRMIRWF